MIVLAVDPGLLSGVALVTTDPLTRVETRELDPLETVKRCHELIVAHGGDLQVACERYTITPSTSKKTQQPWSLYIIGALWYLCECYPVADFELQTPADAKTFVSNTRLRQLDLWHVGGKGHANDALRHAVLRLARLGWTDPRLLG